MRHANYYLLCVIAVIGLAGVAWAGTFNDIADGEWTNIGTWDEGAVYPGSGDTVIIDSHTVHDDQGCPADIGSVTVSGTGTLIVGGDWPWQDFPAPLTLDGGTLFMKGGHNRNMKGLLTVSSPSTIQTDYTDPGYYPSQLDVGLTGTGKVTKTDVGVLNVKANNTTFSGGWDVAAGMLQAAADGALGTGPITVGAGGVLRISSNQDTGAQPSSVTVAGTLYNRSEVKSGANWTVELQAGSAHDLAHNFYGTITVTGDTTMFGVGEYAHQRADISGAAGNTITLKSYNDYIIYGDRHSSTDLPLSGDNSGFLGDWDLVEGTFQVNHDNALGTNAAGGTVTVLADATLQLNRANWDRDVTVEGGTLYAKDKTYTGAVALTGDATLYAVGASGGTRNFTLNGDLTQDASDRAVEIAGDGAGRVRLYGTGNDYAGGTRITRGGWVETNGAKLGTGDVTVTNGKLVTNNNGSACLTGITGVEVTDGVLVLDSSEADTTVITVNAGGGLALVDTGTSQNWGTNLVLHSDAALDPTNVSTPPDRATEIVGGGQLYKGLRSNDADTHSVGPHATELWKGIAVLDNNVTFSGTLNENTAGEGYGITIADTGTYSRWLTLDGATLNGTGAVAFDGGGSLLINGNANTLPSQINATLIPGAYYRSNLNGSGCVVIDDENGLPSGTTLNMDGGILRINHPGALADSTATVNLANLALFKPSNDLYSGTMNFNDGGTIWLDNPARLAGGAAINFNAGSRIVAATNLTAGALPGNPVTIIITADRQIDDDIVLDNDTRLTTVYNIQSPWINKNAGGRITTIGDYARLASWDIGSLHVGGEVYLPGRTLVIGDTEDYWSYDKNANPVLMTQTGKVRLHPRSGVTNTIGKIDIQAGKLQAYHNAGQMRNYLGDAAEIHIAAAGTFQPLHGNDGTVTIWNTRITGSGLIRPDNQERNLRFDGTTLAPGDSIGVLTVNNGTHPTQLGKVDIDPDPNITTYAYTTFEMEVVGNGATAGTDHDQVVFAGGGVGRYSNDLRNADLVVDIPVLPSIDCNPDDMQDKVLITTPDGAVQASVFNEIRVGANTEDHWAIDAPSAVTYNADSVVLNAASISWTAIPGDADLDGTVQLSDLSILAFNWENDTGMTWSTADFDFDGVVNLSDLSILAFHWEETEAAGAPPVPEPMTVGLLLVGGVALLRRRRR